MAQKTFILCSITFYVSASKTSPKHLGQGSWAFPPTVKVFILKKEQGEVLSNIYWSFYRIWMWYDSLGLQTRISALQA